MTDERTESYFEDMNLKYSAKRVSVEIEIESKLNNNIPVFDHTEKDIAEAYNVFKYWHSHKENFSITACANYYNYTYYQVKKVFDKYLRK